MLTCYSHVIIDRYYLFRVCINVFLKKAIFACLYLFRKEKKQNCLYFLSALKKIGAK